MAWFAAAAPYIAGGLSIASTIGQGNAQERIAEIEADQLENQALADKAQAIQDAKYERRKSELLQSRVRALASADSPDIGRVLSDIDEQGEYNAWAALYSGSSTSKKYAAEAARARGKSQKASSRFDAGSTILSTINYG